MAAPSGHQPRGSDDLGVFDDAKSYYTEERHMNRAGPRTRTYSQVSICPLSYYDVD
jgi:alpha,alpha-trehalase